jgi:hypothetical protein
MDINDLKKEAKERESLFKTFASYAAIIIAARQVSKVIAPRSKEPYRSTF